MPTIDNNSKVNPLSSLDRSTSTMMFDLPQAPTPEPSARGSIGAVVFWWPWDAAFVIGEEIGNP
jgi:hypothetical protein